MNAREQVGHIAQHRQAGVKRARVRSAVTPFDQTCPEPGRLCGGDIDGRIPAEQRRGSRASQRLQRQQRAGRVGFARPVRRAAEDAGKMPVDPQIAEDLLAQALRLVGADRHSDPAYRQFVKRGGDTGKQHILRHLHNAVTAAELVEIGGRIGGMRAQHGGNHRHAAHGIHRLDHRPVRRFVDAAVSQHLVENGAGDAGTVDQCAVKVEDDIMICHAVHLEGAANSSRAPGPA